MKRLTKFFITLPVLSLPLWGLSPPVQAEAVLTQMDALRLLAKTRAADGKCNILPAGEAEELGLYLARAEVAAATRNSVSEIQSTISLGKVLGDTAPCSEATSGEVGATLAAAREAMAMARQKPGVEENLAEDNPVARRTARRVEEPRGRLADYGRQAFAYYVERRCEFLSRRDIRAFWVAIIREHRAALSAYGRPAVNSTLRRAEARASEMECGAKGRQLVRAEYTRLAGN